MERDRKGEKEKDREGTRNNGNNAVEEEEEEAGKQ